MEEHIELLQKAEIFKGIEERDLKSVLKCLDAKTEKYKKDETVFTEGDRIIRIGIVLSGRLHLVKYDYYGREDIISGVTTGDIFGEAAAFSTEKILPLNVVSVTDSEILFIDYKRLCTTCGNACAFHSKLIESMITVISDKNIKLNRKLDYMSRKKIRDKLLAYLYDYSKVKKSKVILIPFNREQLADYLSVDRSALSAELGKMRKEGILNFRKNRFELKGPYDNAVLT